MTQSPPDPKPDHDAELVNSGVYRVVMFQAIDALMSATRVKPVMPLFMLLGKTQMKAKQFKEAAASFERALDLMVRTS